MHAQATIGNSNLQTKKKKGFPERNDLNAFYDKYINNLHFHYIFEIF